MEDRKSWTIKNEAILDDLVSLVNLTADEKETLANMQEQARAVAPELSAAFYQRLSAHPLTAEYVTGQIADRKETLESWFVELFSGDYGAEYVQRRLKIGQIHVYIGLPIRYPLAMIDVILEFGVRVVTQNPQPDQALRAFRKLLALDMAIFNQAYEDTQLKHLVEAMGNERLARRVLIQG